MWIVDTITRYPRVLLCFLLIVSTCFPSVDADKLECGSGTACPDETGFCEIKLGEAPSTTCIAADGNGACKDAGGTAIKKEAGLVCTDVAGCCCLATDTDAPGSVPCNDPTKKAEFCKDKESTHPVVCKKEDPTGTGGPPAPKSSPTTVASTVGDASGSTSLVPALSLILASLLVLALPSCV